MQALHCSTLVISEKLICHERKRGQGRGWAAVPVLVHALVRLELGLELGLARVERVEHDGADERADCPDAPDVASVRLSLSMGKNMRASKASNQNCFPKSQPIEAKLEP